MISQEKIKELAKEFQTREDNIIREYLQHLFLFYFYQQKESENVLFKGGTALKMLYQSPRFSEDLDFSSKNFLNKKRIEKLFVNTLVEISKENIKIDLIEGKFTTGGYLGIVSYNLFGFKNEIFFEVSFRKKKLGKEATTIVSEYLPPYLICHLSPKEIAEEKIFAVLERRKPRDYYDVYFILRPPILNKYLLKNNLKKIKKNLAKEEINFKKELSALLPVSHHLILKNFKQKLLSEIEKFF